MKVLVIGGGGREHALAWKLSQSERIQKVYVAPGNGGTARDPNLVDVPITDVKALREWAQQEKIELTVVGPEAPLAAGVVDEFRAHGMRIFGPTKAAAQLESSKAFSKAFMHRHGIPTAIYETFTDAVQAHAYVDKMGAPIVVKADGLALGKGVLLTHSTPEAEKAVDDMLLRGSFGEAGSRIVIQELLEGIEISLHALCDGKTAKLFPTAQDHKRISDGDLGLNTGGMGAYSPAPFIDDVALEKVGKAILEPWLAGCAAEGIDFRGLLYPGVMLTANGPKVLEFNARKDLKTKCFVIGQIFGSI